jgi:hypothetical protein
MVIYFGLTFFSSQVEKVQATMSQLLLDRGNAESIVENLICRFAKGLFFSLFPFPSLFPFHSPSSLNPNLVLSSLSC